MEMNFSCEIYFAYITLQKWKFLLNFQIFHLMAGKARWVWLLTNWQHLPQTSWWSTLVLLATWRKLSVVSRMEIALFKDGMMVWLYLWKKIRAIRCLTDFRCILFYTILFKCSYYIYFHYCLNIKLIIYDEI